MGFLQNSLNQILNDYAVLYSSRNSLGDNENVIILINSLSSNIKELYKNSRNNKSKMNTFIESISDQLMATKANLNEILDNATSSSFSTKHLSKGIREKLNSLDERLETICESRNDIKVALAENNENYSNFYENAKIIFKNMKSIHLSCKITTKNTNTIDNHTRTTSQQIRNDYLNFNTIEKNQASRSLSSTQRKTIIANQISPQTVKINLKKR